MSADCTSSRLVYKDTKTYWKIKVTITFHIFEYNDMGILELFAYDCSTGADFNHICFSRAAILDIDAVFTPIEQAYQERLIRLKVIREKTPNGFFDTENELMRRDIEDRLVGEYIVSHINVGQNCGYGEHNESRYEIQFDPPEEHNPNKLVVFRPAELDGVEPYREVEMISPKSLRPTSLMSTVKRQRKVVVKENVVTAFKGALLSGLSGEYNFNDNKQPAATFISPTKSKFQRSVKKIMLKNAVAKVSQMLAKAEQSKKAAQSAPVGAPPVKPKAKSTDRPRRRTLGVLEEDLAKERGMPVRIPNSGASDVHSSTTAIPLAPKPTRPGRRKLKFTEIQKDSESIEKEVALTESVIEAFHKALVHSIDGCAPVAPKSDSYKTGPEAAPPSAAKTRWKRSIKRVMLQKAVSRVNSMLTGQDEEKDGAHINAPQDSDTTDVAVIHNANSKGGLPASFHRSKLFSGSQSVQTVLSSTPVPVDKLPPPTDKPNAGKGFDFGIFQSRDGTVRPPKPVGKLNSLPKKKEFSNSNDGEILKLFPVL